MMNKTFVAMNARMNSLEENSKKITLKDLIEMVEVKANEIMQLNREKMMEAEAEERRLNKMRKKDSD